MKISRDTREKLRGIPWANPLGLQANLPCGYNFIIFTATFKSTNEN